MRIPFSCRFLIQLAALFVPALKRNEWRREWEAELWHRAEAGTPRDELVRRAAGAFRDAAWFLRNEWKKNGFDPFGRPLRVETGFLLIAVAAALLFGAFRAPVVPYKDGRGLVVFVRKVPLAAENRIKQQTVDLVKKDPSFSAVSAYSTIRQGVIGLRVTRDFFATLGVQPALGRAFREDEPPDVIVLTDGLWRKRFHGDPRVIGKWEYFGYHQYRIIGVLPESFWFRSPAYQFYTPSDEWTRVSGILARLKPGVNPEVALNTVRKLCSENEALWVPKSLVVSRLLEDHRLGDLLMSLGLALAAALLAMGFLIVKGLGGWRYWLFLGGRMFMTITGLALLRWSMVGNQAQWHTTSSIFGFWIFLMICVAAGFLLVIDHRSRCLVCLRRLRKPVSIGVWSSQILDQPATEYLCPAGHGTLYIAETGNAPAHWTVLDESWRDLFVHFDS